MRWDILVFLSVMIACGRVEVTPPANPSEAPATATATGTATATAAAPAPAPAPAAAPAAPQVVVNNNINNTQNNAPGTAPAAPTAPAHPGLIAKGDTEAEVQAVLGTPERVGYCVNDATGWYYGSGMYCIGFVSGAANYQWNVPANKLYLPSW